MKKKILLSTVVVVIAIFSLYTMVQKNDAFAKAQHEQLAAQKPDKLPNDYLFMQRAYPTGEIKPGAYREAAIWRNIFVE